MILKLVLGGWLVVQDRVLSRKVNGDAVRIKIFDKVILSVIYFSLINPLRRLFYFESAVNCFPGVNACLFTTAI